jgi:rod shape-determining protein MreC
MPADRDFRIVEARVINNSIISRNNTLTINRGKSHGITPGMGVIGSNGIVGIIKSASKNFSVVLSLLHSDTRISASIRRNNFFGSLIWTGNNPKIMHLEAIPKHADLVLGDTVQTSGYSHIFPEGIIIGHIHDVSLESGNNFYTIEVALNNDLSNVHYVYVVEMRKLKEIRQLEMGSNE